MTEYIHPNGFTYTEDELITAAEEDNIPLEDFISKKGIKPKSPGKPKPVVKKNAVATAKNTAFNSEEPSSVSPVNPFGKPKTIDPLGLEKFKNAPAPKAKKQVEFNPKKFAEEISSQANEGFYAKGERNMQLNNTKQKELEKKTVDRVFNDFDNLNYSSLSPEKKLELDDTAVKILTAGQKPGTPYKFTPNDIELKSQEILTKASDKKKSIEGASYLDRFVSGVAAGANYVGESFASIPETVYRVFALPQNTIAAITGNKDLEVSPEKFKKQTGTTNPVMDYFVDEQKKIQKANNIFDNANYDSKSITENLKNGNYSDAFKLLGTGLAESAPISIGMMAGGANMSIGKLAAASTVAMAGPEVRQQKEANPELSEIENVMNGFGMAGAESVFSAIGEGSIGRVYKDIIKKEGLDTGARIFKDGLISTYQTALKKYGVPTAMLGEGLEEVATTITQNLISKKPAFDNTMDSFIAGVGGGAVWGSPITLQKSIVGFKDGLTVHKINTELKTGNASNLKEVFNPNTPITETQIKIASIPNSYKILTSQIDNDVAADNMTAEEGDKIKMEFAATYHAANKLRPLDLPANVNVEVTNLLKDRDQLNRVIKNVDDPTLTAFQIEEVKGIDSKIKELTSTIAKEKLAKNLAVLNKNVGVASQLAKMVGKQEFENPITNPDGTVDALVSFDTQEEGQKALDEYNEKMGLPKSKLSNTVGTNLENGQIIINKELAAKTLEFNVGGHELLHKILVSSFRTLTEQDLAKATDLKDKFLSILNAEELAAVNERITAVDENEERLYTDEYLVKNPDEYMTQFFEIVASKKLTWSDKLADMFARIGDLLLPFLKEKGFDNLDFQDGKDVYDFIKDYNKNLRRGKLSKRAIALGDQGINIPQSQTFSKTVEERIEDLYDAWNAQEIGDADFEAQLAILEEEEANGPSAQTEPIKKEPVKKEITTKEPRSKGNLQNLLDTKYDGNPKKLASEGLRNTPSGSVTNDFSKSVIGKELGGTVETITRRLYDPIAADAKRGVTRDEYKDALIQSAALLINNEFDPSKQTLDKFISSRLNLRANALAYELGIEGATKGGIKKDVEDQKALIAEETVTEVKEKPKYKNALESKVFPPEVLETAYKKIITVMRTLKSRIDTPVSLNRTVTPLISEIKDEVGKLLDIDIKTMLGGKKDGVFRKELLRNKRYILENMTTTWLMAKDGQGGIPQAIQKQINGKWVNFPDWVGQKIDREKTTTDQAGRTSGAEIVRRLPNVANNISDEVFLAQIIGPDGNPIRGRKESLSKAMAEEGAFDIINNDLEEQGLIYDALKTNQERLGYEVTNVLATEVARQADRGNVKQSRIGVYAIDRVSKEFYNFYKDLDSATKSNVLQYLDKRETKYLKNINEKDENNLLSILSNWQNAYIDNIAKLEAKFFDEENQKFKEEFYNINDFDKYLLKEVESIKTSKTAALKIAPSGLDFNAKNIATINEIKTAVKIDLEQKLKDAKTKKEKINVINSFLRTYRAIFTGGTVGKRLYGTNAELFKELNTIKGFKDLGYALKGKDDKASIVNKQGVNPTFVYEQSASAKDVGASIKSGKDAIATEKRNNENIQSLEDVLNFVDWVKKSNMTNKAKAMLSIALGTSTYSPLRTLAKIDSIILDANIKDPKDYVWEHALPVDEMVRGILSYVLDLPIGLKPALSKKDLEALLNESKVSIIPIKINGILNKILKDKMPSDWKIGDNIYNARYFNQKTLAYLIKEGIDLSPSDLVKLKGDESIIKAINFEERKQNIQNINNIEAVTRSLDSKNSKVSKGISVFDFDDTVGLTSGSVLYTMPDGTTGKLNAEEFAKEGGNMLDAGAIFDFSEFSKVVDGKPGPMVEKMKKMIAKFGPDNFFILTARPANSAGPIHEFLSSIGIDIPLENITGLGSSLAQSKADWITAKAAEGYNDFYFADDAIQNVTAVKNALDVLDVKSKIQQARLKFSKAISPEFNKIIEENTGMENYKVFSDIVARRRGADKNRFDFYVPPSAADFELLLYNFIGKGKRGEEQQKFFADALLKPYANGNDLMDAARQSIKRGYKALTDQFPNIKNKIEKLTPDGDFTYDQAIRVAMWTEEGVEIPGISQRDQKKLTELVNSDPELVVFKQGLIIAGRQGKGWVTPTEFWDASTIISDLHNLTEGEGRKKFLAEFIDNAQEMFGKWENGKLVGPNINKVEAVYGTNVREAIEDVLWRMTTGKNRSQGKDKETSMWANWVTGSTGAIMFLNVRSAALQLIGAVNFLNLRDNNPIAAAAAFANQKQYWEDFARIWNSDKMKERRGGLKEDVAAAEIANAAAGSKNKVGAVLSYLLKIGYTPTQMADSFAIASGGAPFYRNRIKSYLKEGMTEQDAETAAWSDFTKVSDETQQSGDPRDISKQQASGAGRLLLTFQNTAMQQSRIVKKAILDLKNRRGNDKTNVAKIAYYLAIQNTMFAVLQQGLFAVAFGYDDEDQEKPEKEKKLNEKLADVADGVVDTILRGTGFAGGVIATLKNMAKKYLEEKDKKFKADYAKVMLEGANISPPIGSKLRKLYSGLQQSKFEKDLIEERGWGVMQDGRVHLGPMYGVSGKLVESFTNVPMDRLVTKIENASQAMNTQNEAWQRVMVGLGWSPYSIGIEDSTGDQAIKAKAKEIRKEEGKIKAKETRERTKDSIKALPIEERIKLKRESALKRREERIKKRNRKMG